MILLVPQTQAENESLIGRVQLLQERENLSVEERALVDLMIAAIEKFEDAHYSTKRAQPFQVLTELMRARGLQPKDIYEIFGGSKGTTSAVLRGKRGISKAAAKALAERFGVSAELFL